MNKTERNNFDNRERMFTISADLSMENTSLRTLARLIDNPYGPTELEASELVGLSVIIARACDRIDNVIHDLDKLENDMEHPEGRNI